MIPLESRPFDGEILKSTKWSQILGHKITHIVWTKNCFLAKHKFFYLVFSPYFLTLLILSKFIYSLAVD